MRKHRMLMAALCCSSVLALGVTGCSVKEAEASQSQAVETSVPETEEASPAETEGSGAEETEAAVELPQEETDSEADVPVNLDIQRIWGPVISVEEDQVWIDNQSEIAGSGEIIINISPDFTRVLDAVDGFPVELSDINKGEVIYAYIGPMMTMSLPPIVNAEAVICQVPQDTAAAEYVRVQEMELQKDDSYLLTASNGTQYQVPADCEIIPYLTRNMVRLTDVEKGSACLIWTDGGSTVHKIVLFAD